MTFVVDQGESLHYSPIDEAYWTRAEALERANHVQTILGVVGTESKALLLANTYPLSPPEIEATGHVGEDTKIDRSVGVRDVRRRLAPAFEQTGIQPLSTDNVGDAIFRYFIPTGVLEPTGTRARERVFLPSPVYWEEAAAAGGHLLDFAMRHSVALAKLLGYARSPSASGRATSAQLTRISMLAYLYRASEHEGRAIQRAELEHGIPKELLSGAWDSHLDKLVSSGFVTASSNGNSKYVEQPEFEIRYDPNSIPPPQSKTKSRLLTAITALYEKSGPTFKPMDIALELLPDGTGIRRVQQVADIMRRHMSDWLREGLIDQITTPRRVHDRIRLDPNQREIARELLAIVDGIAIPTPAFIDQGLEKLYLINSDASVVAHLTQRTRAHVPANNRQSKAGLRTGLRKELRQGPKTTGELAQLFGYDRRYVNSVLLQMEGITGAMDGRSKTWRLAD